MFVVVYHMCITHILYYYKHYLRSLFIVYNMQRILFALVKANFVTIEEKKKIKKRENQFGASPVRRLYWMGTLILHKFIKEKNKR